MSYEIELKAHLNKPEVEKIVNYLQNRENTSFLGSIKKEDIYWAFPDSHNSFFRTRKELQNDSTYIYFTSKPNKKKDEGVEYNTENEIKVESDQWESVNNFCNGLGLIVRRRKYKEGFHFIVSVNGYKIHCEILDVRFLGWFIESEIVESTCEITDTKGIEQSLFMLLDELSIPRDRVESKGYNKLLQEVGHELG